MNYARWQLFYEMAATQFAASYAQNRTGSNEDRSVAAERYAASAKFFADAFTAIEGAVLATRPPMPADPAMMACSNQLDPKLVE